MARDRGAQCKQCRREGTKLFLKGERCLTDKCGVELRTYPPGEHGRIRMKQSEYRLQARQLILHGHWTINGRRVNVPSYQVRESDVIAIKATSKASQIIRDATELT